jgi:hypothetical protein
VTEDSGRSVPCAATIWRTGYCLVTGFLCLVIPTSAVLQQLAWEAAHRLNATLFVVNLVQSSFLLAPTLTLAELWLVMTVVLGLTAASRRPSYRSHVLLALVVSVILAQLWTDSLWRQQAICQGYAYLSGQLDSTAFLQFVDLHLPNLTFFYTGLSVSFGVGSFAVWLHWLRPTMTRETRKNIESGRN